MRSFVITGLENMVVRDERKGNLLYPISYGESTREAVMEKISIEKNSVYGLRDKTMTVTGSVTLTPSSMVLLLGLECTVDIYMKAKYHNKKRIRKKYQKKIDKGSFL